jgi:hypothetical protein
MAVTPLANPGAGNQPIYVINASTQVSDLDVHTAVDAISKQIYQHVAPAVGVPAVPVLFLPKGKLAPNRQSRLITVTNDLDEDGALGYHSEDGSEHIYGYVGTSVALAHGAKALTGAYSISSILSHEVAEMFFDPFCNGWYDTGHGYQVAAEVCDPVENDSYLIDGVSVSNFVTLSWFNPYAGRSDRFDYLGKLTKPFTMTSGGYWVQQTDGRASQKFGAAMPQWRRDSKQVVRTRAQRITNGA